MCNLIGWMFCALTKNNCHFEFIEELFWKILNIIHWQYNVTANKKFRMRNLNIGIKHIFVCLCYLHDFIGFSWETNHDNKSHSNFILLQSKWCSLTLTSFTFSKMTVLHSPCTKFQINCKCASWLHEHASRFGQCLGCKCISITQAADFLTKSGLTPMQLIHFQTCIEHNIHACKLTKNKSTFILHCQLTILSFCIQKVWMAAKTTKMFIFIYWKKKQKEK